MSWLNYIKKRRESLNIKQVDLASAIGVSTVTLSRYENGSREPKIDTLKKIAASLKTTVDQLTDVSDIVEPITTNVHIVDDEENKDDTISIPVLSPEQTACCGNGIPLSEITSQAEKYIAVDKHELGRLCSGKMPFAVCADGNSMTGWGILNGSRVIINPVEDVHDFDIVLVCYRDNLVLKKIQRMQDGSVRLYAADSTCITVPAEDATVDTLFAIWGKAMSYDYHKSGRIVHGL